MVTDLDGTLIDGHQRLSTANRTALENSAQAGVLRVVATGRSLHAARRAIDPGFPIDYLIYSSGAGTVHWPSAIAFHGQNMDQRDLRRAVRALVAARLDFMVQGQVPNTHHFHYVRGSGGENRDFDARIQRYAEFASEAQAGDFEELGCSHLVAIEPPERIHRYEGLRDALAPLHVVRTTSPLDHRSRWIEVYPSGVGKSFAAERLRLAHELSLDAVASIGNDYNDEDLLAWAGHSFVVANARDDLRARYPVVASNADSGVAEALSTLLARL